LIEGIKRNQLEEGLCLAIKEVGKLLAQHFPPSRENKNELQDRLIIKD
jgi:putative membrane protein